MAIKKKAFLIILQLKSLIFLCLIFISQVNSETKVIAKNGDTLLKLSTQYGVSLKELMYKNNFNDANKIIEGEVIIIPLKDNKNNSLTYQVIEGDTLYSIARKHNVSPIDLISINNLNDASFLKPNQIILLPEGAFYKEESSSYRNNKASKKVFFHQISNGEKLSDIAKIHSAILPLEYVSISS